VEAAGNRAFVESFFGERPNLRGVLCDARRAPVWPAFLARLSDPGFNPVAENIAFEFTKDREHPASSRPLGVVRSSASLNETKPTPNDASSCRVAMRSRSDLPQRSSRHTTIRSSSRRRAALSSSSRLGRKIAPEPTSWISTAVFHPRLAT
jgi:hypothetical protein